MQKFTRDLLWSVGLCFLSIFLFHYGGEIAESTPSLPAVKSSLYAQLWSTVLFVLSLVLLIRTLKNKERSATEKLITVPTVFSLVMLFLYITGLDYLGFFICTVMFMTILITYYHILTLDSDKRKIKYLAIAGKYFLFSLVAVTFFYGIFQVILDVALPVGSWLEAVMY